MGITEFLRAYGVEIPADKQEEFNKNFLENYKHVNEVQKKDKELTAANATITDLTEKLKKFDGVDVEKLKAEIETTKTNYENQLQELRLNTALDRELLTAGAHNAASVKALLKRDLIKLDGETLLGLKEQIENLKKSDPYLFKDNAPGGMHKMPGGDKGTGDNGGGTVTIDQFAKMGYAEQVKLQSENPELYKKLREELKQRKMKKIFGIGG